MIENAEKKCHYCEDNIVTPDDEKMCKTMGLTYSLCNECLLEYDNKTGHCSLRCCISGQCDESC